MTPPLDSYSAPEMCRWLRFKDSDVRPSSFTQALCVRLASKPREAMPAHGCAGCPFWEARNG